MDRSLPMLPGRGATANPANRFERLHVEDVPDADDEEGRPRTLTKYYRDHSRGVLTRNDSPDVGFEWSVNPYRGCEHGCAYCLAPDTPVLLADLTESPIADVQVGDVLLGFDEHCEPGRQRKLRPAVVEAKWRSRRPTLRIVTPHGEVVTTAGHQWLVQGLRWVETARLEAAQALLRLRTVRLGRKDGDLSVATTPEPILAVEPGPAMDVIDIQTSTRTFFAAGLATHNCYARPTHEYLGFSAGLDFESRILVKDDAPELLRRGIARRSWSPVPLVMSGVTDPYQPVEARLGITRGCLEVLAEARHPVAVITKSRRVTRDADLLGGLARFGAAHVTVSITTLDRELQRRLEPRASSPAARLEAIRVLAEAGVPVAVNAAPVIPGLTDHEIPAILEAAAGAGATAAGMIYLRLPYGVKDIFEAWLREHVPDRADRVLNRVRDARDGKLNDPRFGSRMRGSGPHAEQVARLFRITAGRLGLARRVLTLSGDAFRRPRLEARSGQFDLFG